MKKTIFLMTMFMLSILNTKAQMTLAQSYSSSFLGWQNAEIVNLSISGKKILVLTNSNTLSFYNLNYTLWKTITLPTIGTFSPGNSSGISLELGTAAGTVLYPSEQLFNTDPLLEVAVFYGSASGSNSAIYIINENGIAVDSITNVLWHGSDWSPMLVYSTSSTSFVAIVSTTTNVNIYSLPGTIPCDACSNGLGLGSIQKPVQVSEPIPNPSKDQVKITFTLPEGTKQGVIDLYSIDGKLLKSYTVDNTFGFITIDNSNLPSGMYYYNLITDGNITTTKKMIVLK